MPRETDYSQKLPDVALVSRQERKELIEELDAVIVGVQRYMGKMPEGKAAYPKLKEVRRALGSRKYTIESEAKIDAAFLEVKKILGSVAADYLNNAQPWKGATEEKIKTKYRVVNVYDSFNSLYREWYAVLHGALELHKALDTEFEKQEKKFRKELK